MGLLIALLFLALSFINILRNNDYLNPDILSAFSTKTVYRHCGLQSYTGESKSLDQCKLLHVTALYRHGSRAPGDKNMKHWKTLYEKLRDSYDKGAAIPKELFDSPIPLQNIEARELIKRGYDELYRLGQRARTRMSKYFDLDDNNVRFTSSSSNRSIASGMSFHHGLLNYPNDLLSFNRSELCGDGVTIDQCSIPGSPDKIKINDKLLRFYDSCKRYKKMVEKNATVLDEYTKFGQSDTMKAILTSFTQRFKLNAADFQTDDLQILYLACAYSIAAAPDTPNPLPWCRLLKDSEILTIDYWLDLKQYWRKSYPHEVSYAQSCPLLSEMLNELDEASKLRATPGKAKFSFWFGHAETVIPITTILGLFNESVGHDMLFRLDANGLEDRLKQLKMNPKPPTIFRSGYIAPMAANVAFNLYDCPEDAEFRVEVLINERTVAWPMAGSTQPATSDHPGGTNMLLSDLLRRFNYCLKDPQAYFDNVCSLDRTVTTE